MIATARLLATGSYLPERVLSNADLEKMVNTSDEWIVTRSGIRERRMLAEGQTNSDMATEAGRRALAAAKLPPDQIDHIAICTFTPDRPLPSAAAMVQSKLGASGASAVDMAAACTGFIYGLSHATGLIATGQARNVLVVASEALTRVTDYRDRSTCVLFGDGAGAAVLSAEAGGHRLGDFVVKADGAGYEQLTVPAGGSSRPASAESVAEGAHYLKMPSGKQVFRFAVGKMIELIKGAAGRAGIRPADIDLVVPHQVNDRIIKAAIDRLDMREEQFFKNLEKYGNTSGASVAIALDEAIREGRAKPGDKVLLVAFGGGYTWGSATIDW